jgi:hypothetical protein
MAIEMPGPGFTKEAAVNLSAKQHFFLVLDGNGRADLPGSGGLPCIGVLQNDPVQFEGASIVDSGTSKVVSNGTIEAGDNVAAASGGKGKEAASGEYILGTALEGDGAVDGTVISVRLEAKGRVA